VCSVRRVPCARGHSVQPSPNAFGLLLITVASQLTTSRNLTLVMDTGLDEHAVAAVCK